MLVLVTGSRGWSRKDIIRNRLAPYFEQGACLLHGGARGADRIAAEIAAEFGCPTRTMVPDWDQHGKRAGILRNLAMLDEKPNVVVAFWDGTSRGTSHCIEAARQRGIPTVVVTEEV